MTEPEAQAAVLKAGLTVVFDREYSEDIPVGQVIRTEPAAQGRILRDGTLHAFLSRGPERYPVPELTGLTREQARTALTDGSLGLGNVALEWSDTVASGLVISQAIPAGEQVKKGVGVDVVISQGPAPVEVQDFTGKPFADAKAWAEKNALKPAVTEEHHDTVPAGAVISQDPPSGTVHRGDGVRFVVSKGPVMVRVPAVRGRPVAEATETLRKAGFEPKVVRLVQGGLGLVLGTDPPGGNMAPKGSVVTLRVV